MLVNWAFKAEHATFPDTDTDTSPPPETEHVTTRGKCVIDSPQGKVIVPGVRRCCLYPVGATQGSAAVTHSKYIP